MNLRVDSAALSRELEQLAGFSDTPSPAITRIVYSEVDMQARAYLRSLCVDAGLDVREDACGNLFARWLGSQPELSFVGTGSHIDAIPHSGRYDGTVGVFGGLEAIRTLQRSGFEPKRSIELLMFTSEEPTRFGMGCLGSRLLCGSLGSDADLRLRDSTGATLREVRTAAGFSGNLESIRLPDKYYFAFFELHIEQGPLLERAQLPLGVVTAIAAPASLRVTIEGEGGHAGAVLMPDRHDAFCAAAEMALELERLARETETIDTVATCGVCDVFPGLVNSIPSRVRLELDIRDIDRYLRDRVIRNFEEICKDIAKRRGVTGAIEIINSDDPGMCDPDLVQILRNAALSHNLAFQHMVSRAYHDSLFMSRLNPTAMLFIPCRHGYSHRPDEYASPEAIAQGTLMLAEALAEASSR